MNLACLVHQHRSDDPYRINRMSQQILAWHQEVPTGEHCEFFRWKPIDNRSNARPVHLADAHRARLATRVEHATPHLCWRELADRRGDQVALGVGRGIAIGGDGVSGRQYDCPVNREQRPEWMVPGYSSLAGQLDCVLHEAFVDVGSLQGRG